MSEEYDTTHVVRKDSIMLKIVREKKARKNTARLSLVEKPARDYSLFTGDLVPGVPLGDQHPVLVPGERGRWVGLHGAVEGDVAVSRRPAWHVQLVDAWLLGCGEEHRVKV